LRFLHTRIPLKALLGYRLRFLWKWLRRGFRTRTILFYPQYPAKKTLIFKICREQGYNITTDLHRRCDLAFAWKDTTWRPEYPELRDIAAHAPVLNLACRDVSKTHLGEVFERTFGYPLAINPVSHEGEAVQKSDENASKSGRVVTCPLPAPVEGCAYQRLVNNIGPDGLCEELRIPVIGGRVPLLTLKHKPPSNRFFSSWLKVEVRETDEILSARELADIARFCSEYGLDWGEIDVLRDRDDGRIYIVDANNTPWGPARDLPERIRREVVRRLAEVFRETWLDA